jgi:hypothetical protein
MATRVVSFRDAPSEREDELIALASSFLERRPEAQMLPVRVKERTVALVLAGSTAEVEFVTRELTAQFQRANLPTPVVETSEQAALWISAGS